MLSVGDRESRFPRSAAAVAALNSAGVYQGPEIRKGIDYLMHFLPGPGVVQRETYYEYGHYYAVQAMWQAGGEVWTRWFPAVRGRHHLPPATRRLLGVAQTAWRAATAMCLMVLQLPNNALPIFQR